MSNTIRIKRRAAGGASGAPSSLVNAELAYNEQDDVLYYGKGTGGAGGTATQVIAIGGPGAFQPKDADLDALAGLSTNGIVARTGNGTATTRTITAPAAGITVTDGDGVAGNPTLALANDLAALEGLASTGLIARTGDGTATTRAVTGTSGRVTVTNGDGVSGAPTIDLDTSGVGGGTYTKITVDTYGRATAGATATLNDIATPTANYGFGGYKITNLGSPEADGDAANKGYVDSKVQGLSPKQSVKAATTANLAALSGELTLDGVSLISGDRVLVKDQTAQADNGIYIVASGAWSRAADMSVWAEVPSAYVFVEQGTANADVGYVCTSDQGGTLGSTAITWVRFSAAADIVPGNGLTRTGNTFDVVGTANRITVSADAVDIASTYAGQTSITIVGTITNGTWNGTTIALANGGTAATDAAGARSNLGLVIGTDVQAYDAELASIAALNSAADTLPYFTGVGMAALATFTAFGRSLVDDTDASGARTTLGLGTIATQAASNVAITGGTIDGITLDGGTF